MNNYNDKQYLKVKKDYENIFNNSYAKIIKNTRRASIEFDKIKANDILYSRTQSKASINKSRLRPESF